jgi:hypothetical protein
MVMTEATAKMKMSRKSVGRFLAYAVRAEELTGKSVAISGALAPPSAPQKVR